MPLPILGLALRSLATRVFKGAVVDTAKVLLVKPVTAVVDAVKEVAVENVDSPEGGQGKPDLVRLVTNISVILFAIAYFAGYISESKLIFIAQFLKSLLF